LVMLVHRVRARPSSDDFPRGEHLPPRSRRSPPIRTPWRTSRPGPWTRWTSWSIRGCWRRRRSFRRGSFG